MKIDGFTYVRNGIKMGYPFVNSIKSLLPLVDEMFVVVGDSNDGTIAAIENIGSDKITIIETIWDEKKRENGEIFKEQADIGLSKTTGDWCFHIQADEVLMENCYDKILEYIKIANELEEVDGLLFPFYHFWGDYEHIRKTRRTHAFEIRAFKNNRGVFSYKDSQGFRKRLPNNKEIKLSVLKTTIPIYHYSYTRNPKLMKQKSNFFHRFWHSDNWIKENTNELDFDFNKVDRLDLFKGKHPIYMKEVIQSKDWDFEYDPSMSNMSLKDKLLYLIERAFNYRPFEYKNYKIKQLPNNVSK